MRIPKRMNLFFVSVVASSTFRQYSHGESQVKVAGRLELLAPIRGKVGSQAVEKIHGDRKRPPWYGGHQTRCVSDVVGSGEDGMMLFVVSIAAMMLNSGVTIARSSRGVISSAISSAISLQPLFPWSLLEILLVQGGCAWC